MNKKIWLKLGAAGLLVYGGLAMLGSTLVPPVFTVHTEIELPASPEASWKVLTDFASYPDWNPYLIRAEGSLEAGKSLSIVLLDDNFDEPLHLQPRVVTVEPPLQFFWQGSLLFRGISDTRHYFVLQPNADGTTRFTQYEEFRGLIPLLLPVEKNMSPATTAAFKRMNTALQQRLANR